MLDLCLVLRIQHLYIGCALALSERLPDRLPEWLPDRKRYVLSGDAALAPEPQGGAEPRYVMMNVMMNVTMNEMMTERCTS